MVPHQRIDERAFKCVSQVQTPRHIWRRNDDTEWFSTLSRIDFVGLISFPNLLPFGFGGFCVVLGGEIRCHGCLPIDLPLSTIVP